MHAAMRLSQLVEYAIALTTRNVFVNGPEGKPVYDPPDDEPEIFSKIQDREIMPLIDLLSQALDVGDDLEAGDVWAYAIDVFDSIAGNRTVDGDDMRAAFDVLEILTEWDYTGEAQPIPEGSPLMLEWCSEAAIDAQMQRDLREADEATARNRAKPEAKLRSAWESLCEQMTAVISESLEVTRGLAREVAELAEPEAEAEDEAA